MEAAATNSGAERTSLNEFRMMKYFKSKWKWFWITSLDIWANIAVTKHVLLADEFIPYRPRLLGFHSSHVNAMKCIYVGFSLPKLQSFFWKNIFEFMFNKAWTGLKVLIIKFWQLLVFSTWASGKALARCVEGPEFDSGRNLIRFFSFLPFRIVLILRITVLLWFYI